MARNKEALKSDRIVMRESDLWPSLRGYWHPVAFSEEVGERPISVPILEERVAVCRLSGEVKAFHDLCIHRGTPLSLGWVEGETIVCAYHGWAYNQEGKCVRIPSIPPGHPIPKKACLTRYLAQERYGIVWVCLAEEPRATLPELTEVEDTSFRIFFRQKKTWDCTAARAIENFTDLAHFPWVHEGILGDRSEPIPPEVKMKRDGEVLRYSVDYPSSPIHQISHCLNYRLTRPFCIVQRREMPGDKTQVFLFVCKPDSAGQTTRFLMVARNFDFDTPEIVHGPFTMINEDIRSADGTQDGVLPDPARIANHIGEQDRPIVERQRPEELPLDLTEELHLKGPDAIAVEYRRFMKELGVDC